LLIGRTARNFGDGNHVVTCFAQRMDYRPGQCRFARSSLQSSLQIISPLRKLCHKCDTKPGEAGKTDFFDRPSLLIPGKLLKTQEHLKIPAYRLTRHYLVFLLHRLLV
jgi:hypothetical protein